MTPGLYEDQGIAIKGQEPNDHGKDWPKKRRQEKRLLPPFFFFFKGKADILRCILKKSYFTVFIFFLNSRKEGGLRAFGGGLAPGYLLVDFQIRVDSVYLGQRF